MAAILSEETDEPLKRFGWKTFSKEGLSRKQGGAGPPCGGGDSSNKTFHRIDPDSVVMEGDLRMKSTPAPMSPWRGSAADLRRAHFPNSPSGLLQGRPPYLCFVLNWEIQFELCWQFIF